MVVRSVDTLFRLGYFQYPSGLRPMICQKSSSDLRLFLRRYFYYFLVLYFIMFLLCVLLCVFIIIFLLCYYVLQLCFIVYFYYVSCYDWFLYFVIIIVFYYYNCSYCYFNLDQKQPQVQLASGPLSFLQPNSLNPLPKSL